MWKKSSTYLALFAFPISTGTSLSTTTLSLFGLFGLFLLFIDLGPWVLLLVVLNSRTSLLVLLCHEFFHIDVVLCKQRLGKRWQLDILNLHRVSASCIIAVIPATVTCVVVRSTAKILPASTPSVIICNRIFPFWEIRRVKEIKICSNFLGILHLKFYSIN